MLPKHAQKKESSKKTEKKEPAPGEATNPTTSERPNISAAMPDSSHPRRRRREPLPSKCARAQAPPIHGAPSRPETPPRPEAMVPTTKKRKTSPFTSKAARKSAPLRVNSPSTSEKDGEETSEDSEIDAEDSHWKLPSRKRGPPRDDDDEDAPPPGGAAPVAGKGKAATHDSAYGGSKRGATQSSAPLSKRVQTGQVHGAATDVKTKHRSPRRKAPITIDPTYRLPAGEESHGESETSPLLSLKQRRKGLRITDRSYRPTREEKQLVEADISPLPSPTKKTKRRKSPSVKRESPAKKPTSPSIKLNPTSTTNTKAVKWADAATDGQFNFRPAKLVRTKKVACILKAELSPLPAAYSSRVYRDLDGALVASVVTKRPSSKAGRVGLSGPGFSTFQVYVK